MSKWQLPTQKGTETWPQTIRSPTVFRVRGAEPQSELARMILERYISQITHFHRSQQQKYSLSTIDNYRAHGRYDGIKLTYTNLQGQETLLAEVRGEEMEEMRSQAFEVYDFALIEIYVPDMGEYTGTLSSIAQVRIPLLQELTPGVTKPVKGMEEGPLPDARVDGKEDVITSPRRLERVRTIPFDPANRSEYTSYLVDLRRFRGSTVVAVDLNVGVPVGEFRLPTPRLKYGIIPVQFQNGSGTPPVFSGPGTGGGPVVEPPELYNANLPLADPLPGYSFDGTRWVWDATGTNQHVVFAGWYIFSGYRLSDGTFIEGEITRENLRDTIDTSREGYAEFHVYAMLELYQDSGFVPPPTPGPGEVQLTLFKSDPRLEGSDYTTYMRWDFEGIYPNRPGHSMIGEIDIDGFSYVNNLFLKHNMPYKGTVIIDQIRWSYGFDAA